MTAKRIIGGIMIFLGGFFGLFMLITLESSYTGLSKVMEYVGALFIPFILLLAGIQFVRTKPKG